MFGCGRSKVSDNTRFLRHEPSEIAFGKPAPEVRPRFAPAMMGDRQPRGRFLPDCVPRVTALKGANHGCSIDPLAGGPKDKPCRRAVTERAYDSSLEIGNSFIRGVEM